MPKYRLDIRFKIPVSGVIFVEAPDEDEAEYMAQDFEEKYANFELDPEELEELMYDPAEDVEVELITEVEE